MKNLIKDFITGLQFLTSIRVARQSESEWSPESFGRSVKFFPLVGAVLGIFLAGIGLELGPYLPRHILAAVILLAGILLSGGLLYDGLMDTADGIFSGRPREKMLEIMKDSRVGAGGALALGVALILRWSLILDMPSAVLPMALFVTPVIGRLAMVMSVTLFPYARPEGIGKAFANFTGRYTLLVAAILAYLIILPFGGKVFICAAAGILFSFLLCCRIKKILGGLTGDVYGAVTECCEVVVLLVFIILY